MKEEKDLIRSCRNCLHSTTDLKHIICYCKAYEEAHVPLYAAIECEEYVERKYYKPLYRRS